jgi:hypothetical protein
MRQKVILVFLMSSLCGCEAISDVKDVYGSYELTSRRGKVLLQISADQSYFETVKPLGAPDAEQSGKWQWRNGRVCLDAFLIPTWDGNQNGAE